jgi:hypothetical protein
LQVAVKIRGLRFARPAVRAVQLGKEDGGVGRRHLLNIFDRCCDHFVSQAIRQSRFPIVQPPWRECRIEQLLHRDIRERSDRVRYRGSKAPQRHQQTLAFIERSDIAGNQCDDQIAVR